MSAMQDSGVARDERTVAVENAGHRLALVFVIFALFIDVIFRGLVMNEASWDLLALAGAGGAIVYFYQVRHKAVPQVSGKRWLFFIVFATVIAAIAATVVMHTR